MPPRLNPVLTELLYIGVKAVARAADSVFEDVEDIAEEVTGRVRKVRSGLRHYDRRRGRREEEPKP